MTTRERDTKKRTDNRFKQIRDILAVILVADALLLLAAIPWHPTSMTGWLLFLMLGAPVYALLEVLGLGVMHLIEKRGVGRILHERTAATEFSWLRVAYLLVSMLVLFGCVYAVQAVLKRLF